MDPVYISAFVQSIQNVFTTMLQLPVQVGEPSLKTESHSTFDVSGIIGLSGDMTGTIVLSFPSAAAERIVTIFTGMELSVEHEDFADAIGELVNMVSGGAKGMFKDRKVSITCPSVVIGGKHMVSHQKDAPCVKIPCSTDCGDLVIEVSLRDIANQATAGGSGAAAA